MPRSLFSISFAPSAGDVSAIVQEIISADSNFSTILAAGAVINDMHTTYLSGFLVKLATLPSDFTVQAVSRESKFIDTSFHLRDAAAKAFKVPVNEHGKPIFSKGPPVMKDAQDRFYRVVFDEQARRREEVLKAEAAANAKGKFYQSLVIVISDDEDDLEDANGSISVGSTTDASTGTEAGPLPKKRFKALFSQFREKLDREAAYRAFSRRSPTSLLYYFS
ncbi:hypothetical protein DL96DRAFT_1826059 [Flagelloscypha sp. PMI_526]|nr:hypothetical protein DL96DRAFT_1826059 [Flagelloscypha sp. PMI_526]